MRSWEYRTRSSTIIARGLPGLPRRNIAHCTLWGLRRWSRSTAASSLKSGAIVEYLVNRHGGGRLQPAVEDPSYADFLFWFHFANGTIMPTELMFTMLRAIPWSGYVRKALRPRRAHAFEMMDAHLAQVPWLAGAEFTTAEIMSAFAFSSMRHFSKMDIKPYPHIRAWLRRIGERPGYRRAMAAGDPGTPPLFD